jgi:hypothetical protein
MAGRASDRNISALIKDLFVLQGRLRGVGGDKVDTLLTDVINAYLVLNLQIIERGLQAWMATSEGELNAMDDEYGELDYSATMHEFRDIAVQAVVHAPEALTSSTARDLLRVDDDQLHMLDRMLEFAKYLANTDDLTLQWSPVIDVLDDSGAAELVDGVRAQVTDSRAQVDRAIKAFRDPPS